LTRPVAYDLVSLGVCMIRKPSTYKNDVFVIDEPWVIEACLCLFKSFQIPIQLQNVHQNLSYMANNPTDAAKGKHMELLIAYTLILHEGKTLQEIPLFEKALTNPKAPKWFKEMANIKLLFPQTALQIDNTGIVTSKFLDPTMIDENRTKIVLPVKESRMDILAIIGSTIFVAGAKFYSDKAKVQQSVTNSNIGSINVDNAFKKNDLKEYESSPQWGKQHTTWCTNLDKLNLPGTICLLVTFPSAASMQDNAPTFEKQSNGRVDVVLRLTQSNMAQFFLKDTCSLLNNFPSLSKEQ